MEWKFEMGFLNALSNVLQWWLCATNAPLSICTSANWVPGANKQCILAWYRSEQGLVAEGSSGVMEQINKAYIHNVVVYCRIRGH